MGDENRCLFTGWWIFFYSLIKGLPLFDHAEVAAGAFFYCGDALFQVFDLGLERGVAFLECGVLYLLGFDGLLQAMDFDQAAVAEPEPELQGQEEQD
jgi:hypothetical protein